MCPPSWTPLPTKSLQSCPTLRDPRDGSPPGSTVPGILQARTLEWVAISFSNEWKRKVKGMSLSSIRLLATSWTAAYQAPPPMGFFQARVLEWVAIAFSSPPIVSLRVVPVHGPWALFKVHSQKQEGFPGGSDGKESTCNAGDMGSLPGSGRYPGEGNDNPLQYSGLENSMDRGAWWAAVHVVTKELDRT